LKRWRLEGKGPKFVKLGQKVAYALDQLLEWENQGGEGCYSSEGDGYRASRTHTMRQ
jgi:hypothetical protein